MISYGSLQHGLSVQYYERGYAVFVWFIRQFTSDYRVLLLIVHSFIYISTVNLLKNFKYNMYTFIPVLALIFLAIYSINTVRIIVALSIFYWVYDMLIKDKVLIAFILALLAVTVHISALIIFPVGMVYLCKKHIKLFNLKKLWILIGAIMLLSFVGISLIKSLIEGSKYVIYAGEGSIAIPTYVMFSTICFLTYHYYDELEAKDDHVVELLIYTLPIGLIILPLQFKYAILYRMLFYIHPILYGLMPYILEVNNQIRMQNKKEFWAVRILIFTFVAYRIFSFFTAEIIDLGTFPF